jgi:acetyl-CoA carboxylase carboxyl transferase subunit beta
MSSSSRAPVEQLPGSTTLRCSVASFGGNRAVAVDWDFAVQGGSFGHDDGDAFVAAVGEARDRSLPLVTVTRSGGTRLPEGMRALVGIPRAGIALDDLRAAGVPHVSVADNPTTGGVWVAIGSVADVRAATAGATLGFSGPRVVTAMTGRDLTPGANTAEAGYDAGLVDALVAPDRIDAWVGGVLAALAPDSPEVIGRPAAASPPDRDGEAQFVASREADRPAGEALMAQLLESSVALRGGDSTVRAALGRIAGRRAVVVAFAAARTAMPGPPGFALLARAARLAGSLDLPLVVLVDTPGADPHAESAGLAPAIAGAMREVLVTPAPTVALVHGEGGSGGALAGAVTDVVGVGEYGWFGALGPEGAAAALRTTSGDAARVMRITPAALVADGFADDFVGSDSERPWVVTAIDVLRSTTTGDRLARRRARWSAALRDMS